jgi:hypothetical protein
MAISLLKGEEYDVTFRAQRRLGGGTGART